MCIIDQVCISKNFHLIVPRSTLIFVEECVGVAKAVKQTVRAGTKLNLYETASNLYRVLLKRDSK